MRCAHGGCPGSIDDGYCDHCGLAPLVTPATIVVSAPALATARPGERENGESVHAGSGVSSFRDPRSVVLTDPQVPEERRFCSRCEGPVGRSHGELPGRVEGFCTACGHPFSFTPKLARGDVVGGQYEVEGCLAHGGLGWVYLARDRNLDGNWVVLKGLLDSGDADAQAVAVAERGFLVEVQHPNVVRVYNSVEHAGSGYLVMEYVAGISLGTMLRDRLAEASDGFDRFSPLQAIEMVGAALPALAHLHQLGLAYCDFKPDNIIRTASTVKLIDLGGVYRMADQASPIYGTPGFQAPEIAHTGPTVESDVYTVGRTLAVLTSQSPLPASSATGRSSLDSFHRLVQRATHLDPGRRFHSIAKILDQLDGVRRQLLAADGGPPAAHVSSAVFTAERSGDIETPDWRMLPVPLVVADDPAAGFLAALGAIDAADLLQQLDGAPVQSVEVRLRRVRALIRTGSADEAIGELGRLRSEQHQDWRVDWYRGIVMLATGDFQVARLSFDEVRDQLPGELAVLSAVAMACELHGDRNGARERYELVAAVDPMQSSAGFGLARCLVADGDHPLAASVLDRIPDASPFHVGAQRLRIGLITDSCRSPSFADLIGCARVLPTLRCDEDERVMLEVQILEAARRLLVHESAAPHSDLLDCNLDDRDLRLGLERRYRVLARHATTAQERIALVDLANTTRPRSWR